MPLFHPVIKDRNLYWAELLITLLLCLPVYIVLVWRFM